MRQADGKAVFALWRNHGLAIGSVTSPIAGSGHRRQDSRAPGSRKIALKQREPDKAHNREAQTRCRQRAAVDQPVSGAIGAQLRALYDKITQQPLPDRFERLLRRLESSHDN